ncbi:hypothetical protein V1525DRAFT_178402 [Lipomyces kononenkoae]|uniref:Uncharacterized protein n=1 Tax=Lipomyces kononenkoae TaxID=34357 RepID=A0ACC3TB63_LIPKO
MMANVRGPQLSFAQSYKLMTVARAKLTRAAHDNDHDLRVLVSHANFLDALMVHLERKDVPVSSPRRTLVRDREEEYKYFYPDSDSDTESDGDSDSESECSSEDDDEEEEEYLIVTSHGRTLSPIPERSRENSEQEDGEDEDEDEDEDVSMEPLHDLRSELYANGSEKKRSVTFLPSLVERTPRDSRRVQFSVHEIRGEPRSIDLSERQAGYFADNDDDDDDQQYVDEDDDMTFYEAANEHKYESTEIEPDDDMPPLMRVNSHGDNRHAVLADDQLELDQEPALPQLTDTTSASDDDDDIDDLIAIRGSSISSVPANHPVSGHSIKEVNMFSGARTPMAWVA